jgi:hypothetical protein
MSISFFQLQMVRGVTAMKCCVSVECQLKGICVNINVLGLGLCLAVRPPMAALVI